MTLTTVLLWGCLGGLLPDLLRVIKARHEKPPDYLGRPFFWISLILLAGLGGGTAVALDADRIVEALAYGFGAPEIVSKLLTEVKPPKPGLTADRSGLLRWWAL